MDFLRRNRQTIWNSIKTFLLTLLFLVIPIFFNHRWIIGYWHYRSKYSLGIQQATSILETCYHTFREQRLWPRTQFDRQWYFWQRCEGARDGIAVAEAAAAAALEKAREEAAKLQMGQPGFSEGVWEAIKYFFVDIVWQTPTNIWNCLVEFFCTVVVSPILAVWEAIKYFFTHIPTPGEIGEVVQDFGIIFGQIILDGWRAFVDYITHWPTLWEAWEAVVEFFTNIDKDSVSDLLKYIGSRVLSFPEDAALSMKAFLKYVHEQITSYDPESIWLAILSYALIFLAFLCVLGAGLIVLHVVRNFPGRLPRALRSVGYGFVGLCILVTSAGLLVLTPEIPTILAAMLSYIEAFFRGLHVWVQKILEIIIVGMVNFIAFLIFWGTTILNMIEITLKALIENVISAAKISYEYIVAHTPPWFIPAVLSMIALALILVVLLCAVLLFLLVLFRNHFPNNGLNTIVLCITLAFIMFLCLSILAAMSPQYFKLVILGTPKIIKDVCSASWDFLSKNCVALGKFLLEMIITLGDFIAKTSSMIWEFVKHSTITFWRLLGRIMAMLRDFFHDMSSIIWEFLKKTAAALRDLLIELRDFIQRISSMLWDLIRRASSLLWEFVRSLFFTIWEFIKVVVTTLLDFLGRVILATLEFLKDTTFGIPNYGWLALLVFIALIIIYIYFRPQAAAQVNKAVNVARQAPAVVQGQYQKFAVRFNNLYNIARQTIIQLANFIQVSFARIALFIQQSFNRLLNFVRVHTNRLIIFIQQIYLRIRTFVGIEGARAVAFIQQIFTQVLAFVRLQSGRVGNFIRQTFHRLLNFVRLRFHVLIPFFLGAIFGTILYFINRHLLTPPMNPAEDRSSENSSIPASTGPTFTDPSQIASNIEAWIKAWLNAIWSFIENLIHLCGDLFVRYILLLLLTIWWALNTFLEVALVINLTTIILTIILAILYIRNPRLGPYRFYLLTIIALTHLFMLFYRPVYMVIDEIRFAE